MKRTRRSKIIFGLFFASAVLVLCVAVFAGSIMLQYAKTLETHTQERLIAISKLAATIVTAEELDEFWTPEDMQKPEYEQIKKRLSEFSEESEVQYTYFLRPEGDMLQFVVDNDFDPETMVSLMSDPLEYEDGPTLALDGTANCTEVGAYSTAWDGLLTSYAPIYDRDGEIYCVAGVDAEDTDILTTRNSIQYLAVATIAAMLIVITTGFISVNLFRREANMAQSANLAKSQFLSRMSHEIRTPMNAVIGLCRMAQNADTLESAKTYLDNIKSSSVHFLHLIDDILDLSKVESGKVVIEEVPTDIEAEVEKIRNMIMPQAGAKELDVVIDIDNSLPKYIYADSTHINQIIINFLSNAVKFTPERGRVTLSIKALEIKDDKCRLACSVKDTGIGIKAEYIDKLFDPFEQGDGSTTRKYGGTGLGLAISKQLVETMGGNISVTSVVNEGSEFKFDIWVKLAKKENVPAPDEKKKDQKVDLSGKTVLLAEDSQINQLIAEDAIAGLGAAVEIAENGKQAYDMFMAAPQKYSYIFMDVQMPVMDGHEATKLIRAGGAPNAKSIPIIAMTANVFAEDIKSAKEAGMNGHIGKPFEIEQIVEAIISADN